MVANVLSHLPYSTSLHEAEALAHHPYHFCPDNDTNGMIMSIFECTTPGPYDTAMSLTSTSEPMTSVNATLKISADNSFLQEIISGYTVDPWCKTLPSTALSLPMLHLRDNLWYIGEHLIIPHTGTLCKTLFTLAHDTLGHFSFHKTYGSLCNTYYWPNMQWDLEEGYVKSCPNCQCNKSSTAKPLGPLHPRSVW